MNRNEEAIYQNSCGNVKAVLRGSVFQDVFNMAYYRKNKNRGTSVIDLQPNQDELSEIQKNPPQKTKPIKNTTMNIGEDVQGGVSFHILFFGI